MENRIFGFIRDNDKVFINGNRAKNLKSFILEPYYKEPRGISPYIFYYFGTFKFEYIDKDGFLHRYSCEPSVYDFRFITHYDDDHKEYHFTVSSY